ncbi:alpha/beta fold hydrolase [Massilia eburnea]|uniref:alpha/beta fold hydrolase n=1 Tax=Massilia eburnea TaxID=1776165 RepID=UPI003D6B4C6B
MTAYKISGARVIEPNIVRTADGVNLFYRDWGDGEPVLFVAGWSMGADSWCYQMLALAQQGMRVIAFDRRGHGRSSDPGRGYDFNTLAGDLAAVLEALDLDEVTLVAHSMGCNEVVRYLSRHGQRRIKRVALLGSMTPCIARTADNPNGIDRALLEYFRNEQLMKDLPKWVDENLPPFVTEDTSPGMRNWLRAMPLQASLLALYECNRSLQSEDFRAELPGIALPVLLIAGTNDASAPFELTAVATAALLPNAKLQVYEGAPHGMFLTHMARVNSDLLDFVQS